MGRFEYVRDTGRAIPSAVALGRKFEAPVEDEKPVEEEIVPIVPGTESEETPVTEVKPNEIEVSKDETWEDPEPKTNVIVDRISALLSVKSIITLAFVFTYLAMVLKGIEVPDLFNNILTMIVSFFFGYQFKKATKE